MKESRVTISHVRKKRNNKNCVFHDGEARKVCLMWPFSKQSSPDPMASSYLEPPLRRKGSDDDDERRVLSIRGLNKGRTRES